MTPKFQRFNWVRHVKSGNTYCVLGYCFYEPTGVLCYYYRGTDDVTWVHPADEMEDGRFVMYSSHKSC